MEIPVLKVLKKLLNEGEKKVREEKIEEKINSLKEQNSLKVKKKHKK